MHEPPAGFAEHLTWPVGRDHEPGGAAHGAAGGAACGDLVRIAVVVDRGRVADAGFRAEGCGAAVAAGSAAVALVRGRPVRDAARVGARAIGTELGGLSPGKLHAADLAADALARALGGAVRRDAPRGGAGTLVAMSGGVDSAVAALLAGPDAAAVTVELWRDPHNDGERSCCSASAVRAARHLAHRLGLPHFTLDLRDEFQAGVVEPWLAAHRDGATPNPCVRCNGSVRLDAMLDFARRAGADRLATGHYARVGGDGEGPLLRLAADPAKDQAYMLAAVPPEAVAGLRFPLGDWSKEQVRARAAAAGLPVARKPDSQDLCFLAGTDREAFLARHGGLRSRPGAIVDRSGRPLGRHRGHHAYTVGQRRGLGVAGGEPLYVLATDPRANRVVVGPRGALRTIRVPLRDVVLRRGPDRVGRVRLRHRGPAVPARLRDGALALDEAVLGAAPGQIACLLDGDLVVGHATIARP